MGVVLWMSDEKRRSYEDEVMIEIQSGTFAQHEEMRLDEYEGTRLAPPALLFAMKVA